MCMDEISFMRVSSIAVFIFTLLHFVSCQCMSCQCEPFLCIKNTPRFLHKTYWFCLAVKWYMLILRFAFSPQKVSWIFAKKHCRKKCSSVESHARLLLPRFLTASSHGTLNIRSLQNSSYRSSSYSLPFFIFFAFWIVFCGSVFPVFENLNQYWLSKLGAAFIASSRAKRLHLNFRSYQLLWGCSQNRISVLYEMR